MAGRERYVLEPKMTSTFNFFVGFVFAIKYLEGKEVVICSYTGCPNKSDRVSN